MIRSVYGFSHSYPEPEALSTPDSVGYKQRIVADTVKGVFSESNLGWYVPFGSHATGSG